MFILSSVQSTFYSSTRELMLTGIVSIVYRYLVSVVKTGFRGIALFLLQVFNSRSRTECFKLSSQLPKRYLNEVLIISASNLNLLFNTWVIPNYQLTYLMCSAMVNYYFCCLIQVVSNAVITPLVESCLSSCKRLNILLVLKRGQISILFVVPLINAFESFAINQKLMPIILLSSLHKNYIANQVLNQIFYCLLKLGTTRI